MRTCALFRLGVLGVAPVVFNWDTRPPRSRGGKFLSGIQPLAT